MSIKHDEKCRRCGKFEVEYFDDEFGFYNSHQCPSCNDEQAERYREQTDFAYWHKGEA